MQSSPTKASARDIAAPRDTARPARRPTTWCGAFLAVLGLAVAAIPLLRELRAPDLLIGLLISAGVVEMLAGAIDHHAGRVTAAMDVVLGLLSLAAGALLLLPGWDSAASLVIVITAWLVVRGLLDLVGSALMRNEIIQDARLVRSSIDLTLGILGWIALAVVPWWEILFGWPGFTISLIWTFAAASVIATGAFLVAESRTPGAGSEPQA